MPLGELYSEDDAVAVAVARCSGVRGDSGVEARSARRGVVPLTVRANEAEGLRSPLTDMVTRPGGRSSAGVYFLQHCASPEPAMLGHVWLP